MPVHHRTLKLRRRPSYEPRHAVAETAQQRVEFWAGVVIAAILILVPVGLLIWLAVSL